METEDACQSEETAQQKDQEDSDDIPYDWKEYVNAISPLEFVKTQNVIYNADEGIRCSPLVKDGNLVEYMFEDAKTLHEVFLRGLKESNNGNCLGFRPGPGEPYQWLKYQEVLDRAQNFGSGLIEKGARPKSNELIGIFARNRVEWSIAEQACNGFSFVTVPLYGTLGPQATRFTVNQCELKYIVVDENEKAMKLLSDAEIQSIKLIVMIEDILDDTQNAADERGIELIAFAELEKLGAKSKKEFMPAAPDDLHVICYTSGTTGNPKGAMLEHKKLVADASGTLIVGYENISHITKDDVYLSFLPLAHALEKVLHTMVFMVGGCVGFYQGDVKLLTDDAAALKPTILAMVPRLMNKIRDKVTARANESWIKRFLFNRGLNRKLDDLSKGIAGADTIWDTVVFRRVQNMFGGRVRIAATGAAPISANVLNFMRSVLGVPFIEGYGQTEGSAIVSMTILHDYEGGNVGTLLPTVMAKLVDVPEKNYYVKENKGELCIKGTTVFSGYYKDPEKTNEAIDEDGWLHTGDIAEWLSNGSIKIIDRKKNIFKLAQGEYIAPEKIEQIYVQSEPVSQVYLHGDSLKSTLVAIVVPDEELVVDWCKAKGFETSLEKICDSKEAAKLVLEDMNDIGRQNGLHSFELAKRIHLTLESFTIEEDLLTPTMKTKRPKVYQKYKAQVDQLYEGLD